VWIVAEKQVNLRLEKDLAENIDYLVKMGIFKTRTEAFKVALRMLIDKYYRGLLDRRLSEIRD